jgi:hypothetical protein
MRSGFRRSYKRLSKTVPFCFRRFRATTLRFISSTSKLVPCLVSQEWNFLHNNDLTRLFPRV